MNRVATVITDGLNMRLEPNTSSDSKGKLKKGDRITIFESKNGWAKSYGYWVSEQYLKYDEVVDAKPNTTPSKATYEYTKGCHLIKCKPLDLKLQIAERQGMTNVGADFAINSTYFWYLDAKKTRTYPTSILYADNKCYQSAANHTPSPQSVMIIYKDGKVDCKQIKSINEIDKSKCYMVIGGMGLNSYNDNSREGFCGRYSDVTRRCNKPFIAYKDGFIYLGIKKNATHSEMCDLKRLFNFECVVQEDGGGSCFMKANGKVIQPTDGRLINNFLIIK